MPGAPKQVLLSKITEVSDKFLSLSLIQGSGGEESKLT
jgi:hypothetical protein